MILKLCAFEQYTTMKTIDDDEPLRIHWKEKSIFLCGALNILWSVHEWVISKGRLLFSAELFFLSISAHEWKVVSGAGRNSPNNFEEGTKTVCLNVWEHNSFLEEAV